NIMSPFSQWRNQQKCQGHPVNLLKKFLLPIYFFHGDHDRFYFTRQAPWEPPSLSRNPGPGISQPPAGLEGPGRQEGQCPSAGFRTRGEHGGCPWGLASPFRSAAIPRSALRLGRMAEKRRPWNTDAYWKPTYRRVLRAVRQGRGACLLSHPGHPGREAAEHFRFRHLLSGQSALSRPAGFEVTAATCWLAGGPPDCTPISVPKFDKTPWLSQASYINKPLVPSIPKRKECMQVSKSTMTGCGEGTKRPLKHLSHSESQ
ncbi:hypothetical protein J0S82_010885, partial [Galemys pyrenaicus]